MVCDFYGVACQAKRIKEALRICRLYNSFFFKWWRVQADFTLLSGHTEEISSTVTYKLVFCRFSDSTMSEDAGVELGQVTYITRLDLIHNLARSRPQLGYRSHPNLGSISSTTRLDLIHNSTLDLIHNSAIDLIQNSARSHPKSAISNPKLG